jgi:hypothetical protein
VQKRDDRGFFDVNIARYRHCQGVLVLPFSWEARNARPKPQHIVRDMHQVMELDLCVRIAVQVHEHRIVLHNALQKLPMYGSVHRSTTHDGDDRIEQREALNVASKHMPVLDFVFKERMKQRHHTEHVASKMADVISRHQLILEEQVRDPTPIASFGQCERVSVHSHNPNIDTDISQRLAN